MKNYDRTDEDYFLESNSNNNVYRVEDDKVRCLNCSDDEEDQNDNENNSLPLLRMVFLL
jgi:hypothetical protein